MTNDKELKAWLEEQTQETCTAIAHRAAMRVLPFAVDLKLFDGAERLAFATFRAILTSGVAAVWPTPDVKDEVRSASSAAFSAFSSSAFSSAFSAAFSAADSAAFSTFSSAFSAADSAFSAFSAADSAADSASSSAAYADAGRAPDSLMEVENRVPETLAQETAKYRSSGRSALDAGGPWAFWAEWYKRAMAGDPLDWKLQEKIALIPDEVWEDGVEAVAKAIERLVFQKATAVAPRLVRDAVAEVFRVEDDPIAPAEIAEFVCGRAAFSLDTALASVSENIFNERSYEAIAIRLALAGPRTVSLLAVGFYDACLGLNSNIGDRYPDEVALVNLMNSLAGIVDELCEIDEDARERCARLAGYNPEKSVDDLTPEELKSIPELVESELDEEAQGIVESDVERLLSQEHALPRWRKVRLTNWLATVSTYWDQAKKAFKEAKALSDIVSKLREWSRNAWDTWNGGDG